MTVIDTVLNNNLITIKAPNEETFDKNKEESWIQIWYHSNQEETKNQKDKKAKCQVKTIEFDVINLANP